MIFQRIIFLASISLTHCLIWLPFSLFNIIVDISPDFFGENATYYGIFTQLFGLASTVINPVLYAFFNENFQREFEDGIEWAKSNFCKRFDGHQGRQQHSKSLSLPGSGNPGRKNTDQVEMVIYFICKMMFDRLFFQQYNPSKFNHRLCYRTVCQRKKKCQISNLQSYKYTQLRSIYMLGHCLRTALQKIG